MMNATEQDVWWKSLIVEFLGTFTLVFVGASAVAAAINSGTDGGTGLLVAAAAFGLALMTLIYVWGSYSGAHFNPAVSFGFAVAGGMNWALMLGYWIAQILGGIAAAALVIYFFGNAGASVGTLTNTDAWKAILLIAILTFLLVIAYLFIYRNPMLAIVSGIVIGSVLALTVLAGGPLVGAGSINPAGVLGAAIFSNNIGSIWIYVIGSLLGALVAALIYKLFVANFNCCYKVDDCGKRLQDECGNNLMECERPILDKCGRPVVDECGKTLTEKVDVIERQHGYKQETYKKEAMQWFNKHGINLHNLDKKCDTNVLVINTAPAQAAAPTPMIRNDIPEIELITDRTMNQPIIRPIMDQPISQAPMSQPAMDQLRALNQQPINQSGGPLPVLNQQSQPSIGQPILGPSSLNQPIMGQQSVQSTRSVPYPSGRSAVSSSPYLVPKY